MPGEVERLIRHAACSLPPPRACFGLPQMFTMLGVVVLLAGCTQTKPQTAKSAHVNYPSSVRVLLLEPDIEVSELTAGGNVLPNAAWTQRARDNVGTALKQLMATRNAEIVPYNSPDVVDPYDPQIQLLKLHSAVGASILIAPAIPTRMDRFDWSMGPDVQMLGDAYDVDYALFVYLRDSFATVGRKAVQFMAAFAGYYGVSGGSQFGFASLVDLKTGQLVWFNQLRSGGGDLRDFTPAREATADLLTEFPIPQGRGVATQAAVTTSSTVQGEESTTLEQPSGRPSTEKAPIITPDIPTRVQESHSTAARSVRTGAPFDGEWVFEIMEEGYPSELDRHFVDVAEGKFTVDIYTNGWRGPVSGQIDSDGNLVGVGRFKWLNNWSRTVKFETRYSDGEFRSTGSGSGYSPYFFVLRLFRQ